MLRKEYYCLVAGLPDLFLNENKLAISSVDFRRELKEQLNHSDYQLIKCLFLPFDNENLIHLLFNQNTSFNPCGLISKSEFEFQLSPENEQIELPTYILRFLKWHKQSQNKEYTVTAENTLHRFYYDYVLKTKNEFLKAWFIFELNIKNILAAFNCIRFNYELSNHLIPIEQNTLVYSRLINKRLKPELFEDELPFCNEIFKVAESDLSLVEKEKALDKIRWDYLDENTFFHYFSIEKILSYTIKLRITERWIKLDEETGKLLLEKLINELETSYKFPAEFSLTR